MKYILTLIIAISIQGCGSSITEYTPQPGMRDVWMLEPRAAFVTYEIYEAAFIYGVTDGSGGWLALGEVPEIVLNDAIEELIKP